VSSRLLASCSIQDRLLAVVANHRPALSDDSDSDLDEDDLRVVRAMLYQVPDRVPDNTAKAELSAWKSWSEACERLGRTKWRGRRIGQKEHLKLGRIVLDIYEHMLPRRKSAYKVYLSVKRLMRREGEAVPNATVVRGVIKGLVRLHQAPWLQDARAEKGRRFFRGTSTKAAKPPARDGHRVMDPSNTFPMYEQHAVQHRHEKRRSMYAL
jgi:hypothetical protein